jgi:hypothetical protein
MTPTSFRTIGVDKATWFSLLPKDGPLMLLENYLFGATLFPYNAKISKVFSFQVGTKEVYKTVVALLNRDEIVVGINTKKPKKNYEVAIYNLHLGLKVANNLLQGEGKVSSVACDANEKIVVVTKEGVRMIRIIDRWGCGTKCDLLTPLISMPSIASKTCQITFCNSGIYSIQDDGLISISGTVVKVLMRSCYYTGTEKFKPIKVISFQNYTPTVLVYYKNEMMIKSVAQDKRISINEDCKALAMDRLDNLAIAFNTKVDLIGSRGKFAELSGDFCSISSMLFHPSGVIIIGDRNVISVWV